MTLVIVGLLLGFAGLAWVIVLDIVLADRECPRPGSRGVESPKTGPMARESKAA